MSDARKSRRRNPKVVIEQRIGPWQVALAWPDDADQGGPVAISIKPYAEASDDELIGGLSSTVLRHIDFRAAREKWLEAKAKYLDQEDGMEQVRAEQLRRILDRDGVTDTYLALLANAYVQLTRAGERSVAGKLAEMTGRSPDTMKQHLHRVRKAGMLTAIPGKAGGQLTQKAYDAIRGTDTSAHEDTADQADVPEPPRGSSEIDKLKSELERVRREAETWRTLAEEFAEAGDRASQAVDEPARAET